ISTSLLVLREFQDYEGPNHGSKIKAQGRVCDRGPAVRLVLLFASFFAAALARQRFLYTLLLARLEVEGVTLHFLNNVLLLHFALEEIGRASCRERE